MALSLWTATPSLSHAAVRGPRWWVPGTRDVVNGLGVEPDEEV
jgi:hypothetical protein